MKKKLLYPFLVASMVTALAGCGQNDQAAEVNADGEVDLSKVTLVLGDQAGLTKSKVEASKVLEGTPYKVEWASFQGAAPLFEAVKAGSVDTAPAGDTPVLAAAASGVPIKIIASSVSAAESVTILVQKDSPIKDVEDLKGKDIVISSAKGSVSQYLVIEALKEVGLTTKDVNIKFVLPTDAAAAFKSGDIEVWATFDPYTTIAEDDGARVLKDGKGINSGIGFITASEEALEDPGKRAALQDVIQRFSKAWDWEQDNKEEYVKIYSDITRLPEDVAREINNKVNADVRPVSNEDIEAVQKVADTFAEEGVLEKPVDVAEIVDKEIFTEE
ncbi:ABC transporter substrate-binding protein [Domibacillus sp. DTU_2020_1001157_1_SI_ALB_TIR_016]|uniref:ABC transporter substrate-binding protein n=1 Tax=Domibacillus sp. DTU_2020_1001157_1_SI_ALB_TIR_016 TaxID=3077789 RepID=UPI0028E2C18B|nr:ABC transporter substrate-binding protein [Domibacillus sp. DTU_2020_1001157_1_SI_ALB_TIR_016]WNS78352.1 ABC transporter substrate-binding protein [Domibacillus sp. DTU_2020_1001157_1_SI_ALB_TIR_016]